MLDMAYDEMSNRDTAKVYRLDVVIDTNYVERLDTEESTSHLEEHLPMFNAKQFRSLVVRPTLNRIGLWSKEAEDLLVGTAAVESRLGTYLKQLSGPALGVFQMEPATHDYLWEGYLNRPGKKHIAEKIKGLTTIAPLDPELEAHYELVYNLAYATAMTRIHYLRFPEAIPRKSEYLSEEEYITALGAYWKEYYNTYKGKGTVDDFVDAWRHCGCSSY